MSKTFINTLNKQSEDLTCIDKSIKQLEAINSTGKNILEGLVKEKEKLQTIDKNLIEIENITCVTKKRIEKMTKPIFYNIYFLLLVLFEVISLVIAFIVRKSYMRRFVAYRRYRLSDNMILG